MTIPESESQFLLNSLPTTSHSLRTSIQHWQLRDLISCPWKERNEVLAVYHSTVALFNSVSQTTTFPLRELSFSPTTMASGSGYLAVGGQRGQVVIRNLSTLWTAQTSVNTTITNSVSIFEHSDQVRLYICSNDETISIYSLPDLVNLAILSLPTAVNSAAVSPDGSKMVAVGDSNQVFLYNIGSSSNYTLAKTLTSVKDAAFSCSWSQSSTKFAVACQDGYVCIWDVRNLRRKLAKLQASQKSACRSVKFSHGGSIDLLAFTEHQSYINIVDARTFDHRESIRVAPADTDVNITGLAFSGDCQSLFVGTEPALLEYHLDTRKRRGFPIGGIL